MPTSLQLDSKATRALRLARTSCMESANCEAPPVGTLLTDFEVLLGVTTPPFTSTVVAEEGGWNFQWSGQSSCPGSTCQTERHNVRGRGPIGVNMAIIRIQIWGVVIAGALAVFTS